jgi:DNA-binding winged helix-turn-helix (wHTH) protein
MPFAPPSRRIFRFGLFELDAARNTLTRSGARVKIQDQPFRVLVMLLERPGEIITREELRQSIWPEGTFVDFEGSLNVIFKRLRAALDDDPDNPRFIETVPRKGYRFIAPITRTEPEADPLLERSTQPEGSPPALMADSGERQHRYRLLTRPPLRRGRFAAVGGMVLAILLGVFGVIRYRTGEP